MFGLSSRFKSVGLDLLPVRIGRKAVDFVTIHKEYTKERSNKQLLVDISIVAKHNSGTGIQRVVTQVLENLQHMLPTDWTLKTIVATKYKDYCYTTNCGHGIVKINNGDIFLALDYAANILPKRKHQLLTWRNQGVKIYTVLYDMLPIQHPEWFTSSGVKNYTKWLKTIAIFSDGLLCISHQVADDAEEYFRIKFKIINKKIIFHVISLGFEFTKNAEYPTKNLQTLNILEFLKNKQFVLIVGTIEPRKGHQDILEAFQILWANNNPMILIFVGRAGWKTDLLQNNIKIHNENGNRLFWFENISDPDLEIFYKNSKGVIVASKGEGYGLPVIEALARNKKVLARNIPILKEVGNENIEYFNDGSVEDYADQIETWLDNLHLEHLPSCNLSTWKDCTQQILMNIGIIKKNHDQFN